MMLDITGQRFGRLIAVMPKGCNRHRQMTWLCKCDCGKEIITVGSEMRRGHALSCGCLNRERSAAANIKHGESHTRLYRRWKSLRQRCLNAKAKDFHSYGGRGISFAEEWNDFPTFKRWAITHGYRENLTLERRNNNDGYSPENCIWIPRSAQAKNKRQTIWRDGLCLKDYCRLHGLNYEREREKIRKQQECQHG
jgi:hypothetical protein